MNELVYMNGGSHWLEQNDTIVFYPFPLGFEVVKYDIDKWLDKKEI